MNILLMWPSALTKNYELLQSLKLKNRLLALQFSSLSTPTIDLTPKLDNEMPQTSTLILDAHFKIFEAVHSLEYDKKDFLNLLVEFNLQPAETIFIGNSPSALLAASQAKIATAIFWDGSVENIEYQMLMRTKPDEVFTSLGELKIFFDRANFSESRLWPIATVGALIQNAKQEVLLVRTAKWSNLYGIPGGKIHYGETTEAALRREIKEETGLSLKNLRFVCNQDCIEHPEFYRLRHFLLLNYWAEIDVTQETTVQLNYESDAYRWVPLQEALQQRVNEPTAVLIRKVLELINEG